MIVITKTADTNARADYFVSCLAGPRVAGQRVAKGDTVNLSEHQARALLLSGEVVTDPARVDYPWGEGVVQAKAAAAEKAAEAKPAAETGAKKAAPAPAAAPAGAPAPAPAAVAG